MTIIGPTREGLQRTMIEIFNEPHKSDRNFTVTLIAESIASI